MTSKREKAFTEAIRLAANDIDEPTGKKKLRLVAEALVDAAVKGEAWAVQHLGDRLDGKPAQEATVTIDDKRDATDWTRAELVAFLNDAKNGGSGTSETGGSDDKPNRVH